MSETGAEAAETPSPDAVRAQLARVLGSDIFRGANQLAAFLTYVVEQTLAGRAGEVKGYTIAVEAFGRPAEFDPQSDPIVRVEAGRLRKALGLYYATDGVDDPVRIDIPVGAYVPVFLCRTTPSALAPLPDMPAAWPEIAPPPRRRVLDRWWWLLVALALALAVMLVGRTLWSSRTDSVWQAPATARPAAKGQAGAAAPEPARLPVVSVVVAETDPPLEDVTRAFARHVIDTMARFDDIVVVKTPDAAARAAVSADYVLTVAASRVGPAIEGVARLSASRDGRVVWASSTERRDDQPGDGTEMREIAQRLAIRLAQPFGIIHADLRHAGLSLDMECLALALNVRRTLKAAEHVAALDCLEGIIARDPDFHPAWSQLAMLTVNEHLGGFQPRPGLALDRALAAAVTAVRLAPSSARAHQAMMEAQYLRGTVEEGLKAGREAMARNPFDPDVMADLGARYVQLGRPGEGLPLLEKAISLSEGRPAWYDFYAYLGAIMVGDGRKAEAHAAMFRSEDGPLSLIGRAMVAAEARDQAELDTPLALLRQRIPLFGTDPGLYFRRRGFAPSVYERIIAMVGLQNITGK
ncbi:hypothetical protein ABE438_11785 [Bosea sp. TWI1241]|uniref:tetratricopeptide repeat protein n=1 Tax=Bosea sp. TWI1241 TaxID=3148904 RepID=UPI003208327E